MRPYLLVALLSLHPVVLRSSPPSSRRYQSFLIILIPLNFISAVSVLYTLSSIRSILATRVNIAIFNSIMSPLPLPQHISFVHMYHRKLTKPRTSSHPFFRRVSEPNLFVILEVSSFCDLTILVPVPFLLRMKEL